MSELVYILLMIFAMILANLAGKYQKKYLLWILIIFLTILAGFRAKTVGVDTPSYYYDIEHGFPYAWHFREQGFRFVANLIMDWTHKPQWMFVLCAFITNALILLRFWDYIKDAKFEFMVFLYLFIYYGNTMNIMRQMVSVALIFYATRYLKDKKYLIFTFFFIVAFSFHRSALLSVGLVMPGLWKNMSKKQKKIFALPFLVILIGAIAYVFTYLMSDIDSYSTQAVSNLNITYFYRLGITLFTIFVNKSNVKIVINNVLKGPSNNYVFDNNIVVYLLIGLAFEALSMLFAFVGRAGLYYLMYEPVFWGIAVKQTKNKQLYMLFISVFAIYIFYLLVFTNSVKLFPFSLYF